MTFSESIRTCFSKYVTFSGRAQRSEFWWWVLFVLAGNIVLTTVDSFLFGTTTTMDYGLEAATNPRILSGIFGLVVLLPGISVTVRRLHDRDMSGWWYWLVLIPIVGLIILLVWFVMEGTRGPNRFGPDPLRGGGDDGGAGPVSASSIPSVPRD